jgi:hypothetical protein
LFQPTGVHAVRNLTSLFWNLHLHDACSDKDRVRLVMLYALRFESEGQRIAGLMDFLGQAGVRDSSPALFAAAQGILQYGGSDKCVQCAANEDGALGCDVASLLELPSNVLLTLLTVLVLFVFWFVGCVRRCQQ